MLVSLPGELYPSRGAEGTFTVQLLRDFRTGEAPQELAYDPRPQDQLQRARWRKKHWSALRSWTKIHFVVHLATEIGRAFVRLLGGLFCYIFLGGRHEFRWKGLPITKDERNREENPQGNMNRSHSFVCFVNNEIWFSLTLNSYLAISKSSL